LEGAVSRDVDPLAEYLAAMRRMTLDDARELMRYGVPLRAIATACPAPSRVELVGGDLFRPNPAGLPAWIFPACVADPAMPECIEVSDPFLVVSSGRVVDLVAFHPAAPGHWALRTGAATAVGAIPPQRLDPDPVPVHRDVIGWLRAECRGIALLTDHVLDARRVLLQIATIQAEDQQHVAQLQQILKTPMRPRPRLVLRAPRGLTA
jgi:hypothetical protein